MTNKIEQPPTLTSEQLAELFQETKTIDEIVEETAASLRRKVAEIMAPKTRTDGIDDKPLN